MQIKSIKTFLLIIVAVFILNTSNTFALEYKLLEDAPGGSGKAEQKAPTFPEYVEGMYNFALGMVVIAALLMITIGGFAYIASAGNQAQAGTAKKIITDAILGLVVVMVAVLILTVINPDLTNTDPGLAALKSDLETNTSSGQKFLYEAVPPKHCAKTSAGVTCYGSEKKCKESGNTPCNGSQNVFEDMALYGCDDVGKCKKFNDKDECEDVYGTGNCASGKAMKAEKLHNNKSDKKIESDIKAKSEGKIEIEADVVADLNKISEPTENNMSEMAKDTGSMKITAVKNAEEYTFKGVKGENGEVDTQPSESIKQVKKNAVSIRTKEDKKNNIYRFRYPDDYKNEKLAGTVVSYKKTYKQVGDELAPVYSDPIVTVPQAQNAKYNEENALEGHKTRPTVELEED